VESAAVTAYLQALDPTKRETLSTLRITIRTLFPDAEECMSYQLPAFRLHGVVVAGFGAYAKHLSYFPHSGSVLAQLRDELSSFTTTRGALHFPVDQPLHAGLVKRLIEVRLIDAQAKARG
jgi:uncharacterized protein YdhG (YjbR/CyaY superfamily)